MNMLVGVKHDRKRFTIITLLVLAGALAAAVVLVTTGTFGSGVASGDDDPAGTTTEPGWRYIAKVVCVRELGPTGPVLGVTSRQVV